MAAVCGANCGSTTAARTRGAAARSARMLEPSNVWKAYRCSDAPVATYVSWVFGEVAPSLAGGARAVGGLGGDKGRER